ncbi:transketolase [Lutibaculum baratangense]|nr:transketolase [Lutibaculum baratangense]
MTSTIERVDHTSMANAIRALAMDAVEAAGSGHPGMPMGAADMATVLFTKVMKFDPKEPHWPDRDRFVLSAGHGSMLLYALLHLLGYEGMPIEEIRNFRQWGSKTPGHPEVNHTPGVETTTGPLGQGLATAVGMAMAERSLNATFGDDIVDHHTYVIASDGDLMEGISHEAISLAGHLKLNRLIVLFDDNEISIDGPISLSESGDQIARFEAAGWDTVRVDGHDPDAILDALEAAKRSDRPSLIACRTIIGYGAPKKQGTSGAHGAALGAEEIAATREALGWPHEPFEIPTDIRDAWRIAGLRSGQARRAWEKNLAELDREARAEFERRIRGDVTVALAPAIAEHKRLLAETKPKVATRKASQDVLEAINPVLPETIGGSADLTGSNNTKTKGLEVYDAGNYGGRFVHYGIREHGMAAAMNGMALHGGVIPYSGTFLVFSDYCRPAIRLSAIMARRVIYVLTHDSIGLGEDGPTHQPVEHLAALRAMPNLQVFRPADATETAECWQLALETKDRPSAIALTRQNLRTLRTTYEEQNLCARGAYEIAPAAGDARVTIFASGSEVEIGVDAANELQKRGIATRVVSVPSFELFFAQSKEYQRSLTEGCEVRVGIEAAVEMGWRRLIGEDGIFIGMTDFGQSAPYQTLYEKFGITAQAVVEAVEARLSEKRSEEE